MNLREHRISRSQEAGGVTILVAFMLLVLMTAGAMAMGRNSLREIYLTGAMRPTTDIVSQADTGLEWSLYWLGQNPDRPTPSSQPAAQAFITAWNYQQDNLIQGKWSTVQGITDSGMTDIRSTADGATKANDIAVMYMGKIARDPSSQNLPQQVTAQLRPDVFCVRSTPRASYTNGPTFQHIREVWTTVPIQY